MANLSAKHKKGTVIHRTTSETLRLGEEALNNSRISGTGRKKSQATSPSSSFQITGVMTRYDLEDESADDLDESHTDEISRVTDNETPSFSEDSRDDQQPPVSVAQVSPQQVNNNQSDISVCERTTSPPPPLEEAPPPPPREKLKTNINDFGRDLGRFRVVKLRSLVPFSRGRWTCYDYLDESSDSKSQNLDGNVTTASLWTTSCQSNYLYTGSILVSEQIPIYVPMPTERPIPISSEYSIPKSRISFASSNSGDTIINNSNLDSNQNRHSLISTSVAQNQEIINSNHETILNVQGDNNCTESAIDTKIEHALDVVKNHLTHAVRLEVEELKIKINELVERISFLEYENDLLRANASPEVLANLGNNKRH